MIIVIYIPPNDKETKKFLQQYIIKKIRENERKNIKVIVIGDFNDIHSKILDQNNKESKRKQSLSLLAWLESSSCEDVYRKIYLYKREYTWSNGKTCLRIDYIWVSRELSQGVIGCRIIDADYITGSDHKIIQVQFTTSFS